MTDLPVEIAKALKQNCSSTYITISPEISHMSEKEFRDIVFVGIKGSSK